MDSVRALKMETEPVLYSLHILVVLVVTLQLAAMNALILAFGQFIKALLLPFVNVGSTDFLTHHLKPDKPLLVDYRYPPRHGH